MSWCKLLVSKDQLHALPTENLKSLGNGVGNHLHALAHGVSGIGSLLACSVGNNETELSKEALSNLGYMLESLGELISNLSDVSNEVDYLVASKSAGGAQ